MNKLPNEKVIFCSKCVESNQRYVSSIQHQDAKKLIKTELHLKIQAMFVLRAHILKRKKKLIGT